MNNAGPTQWDTVDAAAGTPKTWVVKDKTVDYVRDGIKTMTVPHAAVEELTCDATYTVDLPDVFEDTRSFDGHTYVFTPVTKTFTNTTDTDYVVHVANADVQDGGLIWVERTVFDNWYHDVVVPAHSDKTVTFESGTTWPTPRKTCRTT